MNCRISWREAWHFRSSVTVSGLGSNRIELKFSLNIIQSNLIHLAAQALIKKRNWPRQDSLMPVVRPHVGLSFSSLLSSTDHKLDPAYHINCLDRSTCDLLRVCASMSPTWFPLIILAMTLHQVYIQFRLSQLMSQISHRRKGVQKEEKWIKM